MMIILKSMFHDDSVAVVNFYVYDHLVPTLTCDQRPSEEVFNQITSFMSSTLEVFKQGQVVNASRVTELKYVYILGRWTIGNTDSVSDIRVETTALKRVNKI